MILFNINWLFLLNILKYFFFYSIGKFGWFSGLSRWWRGRWRRGNISQEKTSSWLLSVLLGTLNVWSYWNAATVQELKNWNQKAFSLELIIIQGVEKDSNSTSSTNTQSLGDSFSAKQLSGLGEE